MKRIVSWAAIILLALAVYLNVFLTLGERQVPATQTPIERSSINDDTNALKDGRVKEEGWLNIRTTP